MNKINIGLILLSILFFALVVLILTKGFALSETPEKLNNNETLSANMTPAGIQNYTELEEIELTESNAKELKISGEVLSCTNVTDVEQVVDIRLINLDVKTKSINIYPLNITIDLLPEQIKRIDHFIPYGTSSLKLVSSDGEEIKLKVPACIFRGGSGGGEATFFQIETTPRAEEIPEYPTIALPVIAILALLFITKKKTN